ELELARSRPAVANVCANAVGLAGVQPHRAAVSHDRLLSVLRPNAQPQRPTARVCLLVADGCPFIAVLGNAPGQAAEIRIERDRLREVAKLIDTERTHLLLDRLGL